MGMGGFTAGAIKCVNLGMTLLAGGFIPANGANPSTVYGPWISSVARSAEGLWTVTMKARYIGAWKYPIVLAQYQNNTIDDGVVVVGEISLSAGTIKLGGYLAGVADDLAAGTPKIHLIIGLSSPQMKDGGSYA